MGNIKDKYIHEFSGLTKLGNEQFNEKNYDESIKYYELAIE